MVSFTGRMLTALILAPMPLAAQETMALVTDVSGRAYIYLGQFLGITAAIPAHQTLTLEPGCRLVMVHVKTGEEFTFQGPCKLRFNPEGRPEGAKPQSVKKPIALQGSIRLKPESLAQASLVLREVDTRASAVSTGFTPRGPVLLDPLPDFRWHSAGTNATYRLDLTGPDGSLLLDLSLDENHLKLPEHLALVDGLSYVWRLHTTINGEVQTESGKFKLLPKLQRDQLQAASPKEGASFSDRLVYAALLEQLEVRDEARALWKSLAKERPGEEALKALSEK